MPACAADADEESIFLQMTQNIGAGALGQSDEAGDVRACFQTRRYGKKHLVGRKGKFFPLHAGKEVTGKIYGFHIRCAAVLILPFMADAGLFPQAVEGVAVVGVGLYGVKVGSLRQGQSTVFFRESFARCAAAGE